MAQESAQHSSCVGMVLEMEAFVDIRVDRAISCIASDAQHAEWL